MKADQGVETLTGGVVEDEEPDQEPDPIIQLEEHPDVVGPCIGKVRFYMEVYQLA